MVRRSSLKRERLQREFGQNVRRWRKVNGLTASELANRASVTRDTLRAIETGTGAARFDSVLAVLSVIGIAETVVHASDPYRSESARPRIDAIIAGGGEL
ncbi:helix-turn-helix domain-containing protein [Agromyces sp. LHK192]|uniref:helix-turn-helix domain-containing protein n=1 Tax=Agromyces sp. LHK192 TaxID=2498704 RepID=UPI0013E3F90C|nr:helix-turn-helix transcriptional regulator [Agromyces sp. LHK192]